MESSEDETEIIQPEDAFLDLCDEVLSNAMLLARRTLKLLYAQEYSGNSNHGVTELTFKLLLLQAILDDGRLAVQNERKVEGGRTDLVLHSRAGQYTQILELKYIRAGFSERAPFVYRESFRTQEAKWKNAANEIAKLSETEILDEVFREKFDRGPTKKIRVGDRMVSTITQCKGYMRSIVTGGLSPLPEGTVVSGRVIIGIARSIISSEVIPAFDG